MAHMLYPARATYGDTTSARRVFLTIGPLAGARGAVHDWLMSTETAMSRSAANRNPRPAWVRWVAIAGMAAALAIVALWIRPVSVDGEGRLGACQDGTPFILFDDGTSFYDGKRTYLTLVGWPEGMRYDNVRRGLYEDGTRIVGLEERLSVKGTIIDTPGDPGPCWNTIGLRVDSLEPLPEH